MEKGVPLSACRFGFLSSIDKNTVHKIIKQSITRKHKIDAQWNQRGANINAQTPQQIMQSSETNEEHHEISCSLMYKIMQLTRTVVKKQGVAR